MKDDEDTYTKRFFSKKLEKNKFNNQCNFNGHIKFYARSSFCR